MEEIERSAASVEEAVEAALAELGISEQEARIEIVQEPRLAAKSVGERGPKALLVVQIFARQHHRQPAVPSHVQLLAGHVMRIQKREQLAGR